MDAGVEPGDFGAAVLRAIGPASAGSKLTGTSRVATADVLARLFTAAAGGSVYGPSLYGAYGRLASWEALSGLAGLDGDLDVEAAERAADACVWLFYASDWHLGVHPSMDYGIAALRPDRCTVAILAATDTD